MEEAKERYKELRVKRNDMDYLKNKLYTYNTRMKKAQFSNDQAGIAHSRRLITLMKEYMNLYGATLK